MMRFMKRLLRLGMTMLLLSAKEQDAKGAAVTYRQQRASEKEEKS